MEKFYQTESDPKQLSPLTLAYVGDGVYELFVRDRVILLPNELPDIAGLSVLRAGVEFGEAKKNRIEPAHGIFMASRAENCRSVLHLTSNDPALFAFLRGEEIPAEGLSGYTAVAADGIVTGFGKASNGVLKNRYPKGLRTHL